MGVGDGGKLRENKTKNEWEFLQRPTIPEIEVKDREDLEKWNTFFASRG